MSDLLSPAPAPDQKPQKPQHPHAEVPPVESNILGIGFAMELGTIIAAPAVVFGLGGRYLDKTFDTGHTFFFIFMVLAFVTSVMTAYKKVREIMARMPKDLPKKPKPAKVDPELAKEQEILHDLFRAPPHE
jgi:hypothetical protein